MPERFNFNGKTSAKFKTKAGFYVTLPWYTWKRHVLEFRKRRHLNDNREAIIQTLVDYDLKTTSSKDPKIELYQKKIPHFQFNKNIRIPRVLIVVVHTHQKLIKTIYDHVTFKN